MTNSVDTITNPCEDEETMLELLTAILNRTDAPVPRCGAYLREAYRTGLLVRSSPWPLLTDDGLRYVEKAIGV